MPTHTVVSEIVKEDAILKALVTDLAGGFKEIIFPIRALDELIDTGIAYDGSSFRGINDINHSDAILQGIEETLVRASDDISDTDKTEYWIICNILDTTTRSPHPNCARSKLITLQKELAKKWDGGILYMGSEPEAYFIADRSKLGSVEEGNANYFNPKDPNSFIITEIQSVMDDMGYHIERAHTEVGLDQFEVNWKYDRAERTADRIQMFKIIAHKVARRYEYDVTFLPKPYPSRNGSGMHCHLSVSNDKANLFYDAGKKDQKYFSDKALQFLTGIASNSRAIAAIANKTEVSYARLVPGFEAPCVIAIGDCNRTAACRIPAIADEATIKYAIRAEFRYPDPMANPYLLACGFIAAGLAGIEENIDFMGFTEEDLYQYSVPELLKKGYNLLPRNLWESYGEFEKSEVLKNALGKRMHEAYAGVILDEIDSCQPHANAESMRRHYFA